MGHQIWGVKATRRFFSDNHWNEPRFWNEEAKAAHRRERVFCASMADVFERRSELSAARTRLWKLIEATPFLDWLLLTKRPQNIDGMVPWTNEWPVNIWLGTSVENQAFAEKRLPFLLKQPAAIRTWNGLPCAELIHAAS
jgi:protein gp37